MTGEMPTLVLGCGDASTWRATPRGKGRGKPGFRREAAWSNDQRLTAQGYVSFCLKPKTVSLLKCSHPCDPSLMDLAGGQASRWQCQNRALACRRELRGCSGFRGLFESFAGIGSTECKESLKAQFLHKQRGGQGAPNMEPVSADTHAVWSEGLQVRAGCDKVLLFPWSGDDPAHDSQPRELAS